MSFKWPLCSRGIGGLVTLLIVNIVLSIATSIISSFLPEDFVEVYKVYVGYAKDWLMYVSFVLWLIDWIWGGKYVVCRKAVFSTEMAPIAVSAADITPPPPSM